MNFKKLQEKIVDVYSKKRPKRNKSQRFITLVEEIGELAETILVNEGVKPSKTVDDSEEFADVFCNLISLADMSGVDIEKAVIRKLMRKKRAPNDRRPF